MPNVQAILKSALEINTKAIVAAKEQESESQERKSAPVGCKAGIDDLTPELYLSEMFYALRKYYHTK